MPDDTMIAVLSGLFMVASAVLTTRANKRLNEAQALSHKAEANQKDKSVEANAYLTAEGIYKNSIDRLTTENKDLRTENAKLREEVREIEIELITQGNKITYLERLVGNVER